MPAITRKAQQIFGASLTPSGNIAKWGSLAAGAAAYSDDPDQIQTAAWLNGLNNALIGNRSPAIEDLNGLFYVLSRQIAYLLQSGVPEWDTGTTYFTGQIVRGIGTAVLYQSMTDSNAGNNPATDTNNWQPTANLMVGAPICKAWAIFDGINVVGSNARLISGFNVTSVLKNEAGSYTVNFTTAMPSANYTLSGSCGSEDAQAYGAGDDGVVVGNITGKGNAIRTVNSCRLFTINPTSKALVSSGCVTVLFFGS
jgi:hypothetical protein